MVWDVVKSEMAVEPFLAFHSTAPDGVSNVVKFDDEPSLMMEPGGMLIPNLHDVREAIRKMGFSQCF